MKIEEEKSVKFCIEIKKKSNVSDRGASCSTHE